MSGPKCQLGNTAGQVLDGENAPAKQAAAAEQELLVAERHAALRRAFMELPKGQASQPPAAGIQGAPPVLFKAVFTALFRTGPRLEAATSPFGVLNTVG